MTHTSFLWREIARNPRRTILAVTGIGLSLSLLSTLSTPTAVRTEVTLEPEGKDTHLRPGHTTPQRPR